MISVEEATNRILNAISPLSAEHIPLYGGVGRYLAEDIKAMRSQPPSDVSAMDGYALRHDDLFASRDLVLGGESAAGHGYESVVQAGECIRIFTGAPIPKGADTVIIQENTERVEAGKVHFTDIGTLGRNIRLKGSDFKKGDTLARKGQRLSALDLALIGAGNHATIPVVRRPVVGILASGDELVPAGTARDITDIIAVNTDLITGILRAEGADVVDLGIAKDTPEAIENAIKRCPDADVFITIGGASVGDYDLIQPVMKSMGLDMDFWKIAMQPGKPLIYGRFHDNPYIGLPGNPVSAYVTAFLFVLPLVRALQGSQSPLPAITRARLAHDLPENGLRQRYLRAKLSITDDGIQYVDSHALQDSAALLSMAGSDAMIICPPHMPQLRKDTPVLIHCL